jgi:hypothetical protein
VKATALNSLQAHARCNPKRFHHGLLQHDTLPANYFEFHDSGIAALVPRIVSVALSKPARSCAKGESSALLMRGRRRKGRNLRALSMRHSLNRKYLRGKHEHGGCAGGRRGASQGPSPAHQPPSIIKSASRHADLDQV